MTRDLEVEEALHGEARNHVDNGATGDMAERRSGHYVAVAVRL